MPQERGIWSGITCFWPHLDVCKKTLSTHTHTHTIPCHCALSFLVHDKVWTLFVTLSTHSVRWGFGKTSRENNKHCRLKPYPPFSQTARKHELIKRIKRTGGSRGSNREMLTDAGWSRCAGFSQSHSRCFSDRQPVRNADSAGRLQRLPVDSRRLRHGDYSGHIKP